MSLLRIDAASESFADSTAVTAISFAAVIVIDDSWLEAVLDNLALANVSREAGMELLRRLENFERSAQSNELPVRSQYQIVIGDHFDESFNAYDMRAPHAMTPHNILETIDRAGRYFVAERHVVALRQLAFFISGNLEDVLQDEDAHDD
jgi:hypothetical protein